MAKPGFERRVDKRYRVHLPVHYRIAQRGFMTRTGTGTTYEMSSSGLSFRSRKPLPLGAHIELVIEWPAKYRDIYPIDLQATGFVMRSESGRTAVRVTSRKFRVVSPEQSVSVSA